MGPVATAPHVVSRAEFGEEHGWRCITIYYYQEDGILADDRRQIVRDPNALVGPDLADKFGQDPDDPDIVLIACPRLRTYFEVCLVQDSYRGSTGTSAPPRVVRQAADDE